MLEQETEHLLKAVHQRFAGVGDPVALRDILAADIPYPIKAFFRADVEAILLEELGQYRKTTRFNLRHPEVENLQQQINSILVVNFEFSKEDFLQRLDDAVHLIANYFIRPQWTLMNVLFEKEDSLPSPALLKMFRYFGTYEYLKDIIMRYTNDKHISSFTRKEFANLLWRVDSEYSKRKSGSELANVLSPAYQFFDFPKTENSGTLPTKALVKYFEDKGLSSVVIRLAGEAEQNKASLSREELGGILEDVRRSSGAFESQQPEHMSAAALQAEPVNGHSQVNLFQAMEEDDRKRFTKKIFYHNELAFRDSLELIGKAPTWKQASKLVDELFIRNDINPYSSDAVRFVEIISRQYHQKVDG